jgi:hypothetical protein
MPDHRYVVVTVYPFHTLTNQSAGEPKRFLVEVPSTTIEKLGDTSAGNRFAVHLATETALDAYTARFGFDSSIGRDVDAKLVTLAEGGEESPEPHLVFNNCRAWEI